MLPARSQKQGMAAPHRTKHKPAVLALLATAMLVAATVGAAPSSAIPLGGKWAHPNYSYFKSVGAYTGYNAPITNAAGAWNAGTKFSIALAPATSAQVSLTVANYGATDWFGLGEPGPSVTTGTYTYGSIKINAGWLNTRHFNCATPGAASCAYAADAAPKKRCVVAHEMGHVIGLAHTAASSNKIMNVDHGARCHTKALTGPTANDKADVEAIY